jgi:hypothetical protein
MSPNEALGTKKQVFLIVHFVGFPSRVFHAFHYPDVPLIIKPHLSLYDANMAYRV